MCVRGRNKKQEKRAPLTWLLLLLDPARLVPRVSPYIDRHLFSFSASASIRKKLLSSRSIGVSIFADQLQQSTTPFNPSLSVKKR